MLRFHGAVGSSIWVRGSHPRRQGRDGSSLTADGILGEDNNIFAVVRGNVPDVHCDTDSSPDPGLEASCQDILDTMATSTSQVVFGAPEDPSATAHTPYSIVSRAYLPKYLHTKSRISLTFRR